jgi:hypothetical protein
MPRFKGALKRLPFKQSEVERSIRAVQNQGITIEKIEICPTTGTISIVPAAAPVLVGAKAAKATA